MLYEEIESLLHAKNYSEAIELITKELNRSFDFSDDEQKTVFDSLSTLLNETQYSLLNSFYNRVNDSPTRSFTNTAEKEKSITVNHKLFIEGKSRLKIERSGYDYIDPQGENIIVLLHQSKDESLNLKFGLSKEWMKNSTAGNYLTTEGQQGLGFYVLNAFARADVKDQYSIMNGFSNILDVLIDNKPNEIKIFFVNDDTVNESNNYNFLFIFFLVHLAYILSANSTLLVRILFRNETVKRIFERTTLKLNDSSEDQNLLQTYSKQKVDALAKKALTDDPNYKSQLDSLLKIIDEDLSILIRGESGVGKSILARIVHDTSTRRDSKFEDQNCGGIITDKLEQNLFGWVKGSFTDAKKDKKGKVSLAEGGTLFLDEIDRAHVSVRNALLTFIENKKYTVIGEEEEKVADVKLIFGTNKDLIKLIKKKEFEEDFYFRISNRIISIPPLRERIHDVELIVDHTLERLGRKKERVISIEKDGLELLMNYSWPGNIRELSRYLEIRFYECLAEDKNKITAKMITEAPFDNLMITNSDDLENLIELLKKFLGNWDISQGDILHKLVAPIMAKLYLDDCYNQWNRTKKFENAMKVVGMGGKEFNKSALQKYYDEFNTLNEILGLDE